MAKKSPSTLAERYIARTPEEEEQPVVDLSEAFDDSATLNFTHTELREMLSPNGLAARDWSRGILLEEDAAFLRAVDAIAPQPLAPSAAYDPWFHDDRLDAMRERATRQQEVALASQILNVAGNGTLGSSSANASGTPRTSDNTIRTNPYVAPLMEVRPIRSDWDFMRAIEQEFDRRSRSQEEAKSGKNKEPLTTIDRQPEIPVARRPDPRELSPDLEEGVLDEEISYF